MIGNIRQNKHGYSIMELTVAIGIFVIAIMAIMGIYTYASKSLSITTQGQKTLSSIRFDIETIARNVRTSTIIAKIMIWMVQQALAMENWNYT